jgi:hypothetical protein
MTSTVSAAASFAIKTWLVITIAIAIFLGHYVLQLSALHRAVNIGKAAAPCPYLKPGCYGCGEDEAMISEILLTERTADQKFDCLGIQRLDVRAGVAECLKHEKRKNLMVIRSWCLGPNDLAELKKFAAETGFKRLLILASYSDAIRVVYDSAYESKNDNPSSR